LAVIEIRAAHKKNQVIAARAGRAVRELAREAEEAPGFRG
jgi:hypothetical protein